MDRWRHKSAPQERQSDGVSEGLGLRSIVREFGPAGFLLAPLAVLVYWLWRRSRKLDEGTQDMTAGAGVLHRARAYDLLVWLLTRGKEREFREHLVGLARLAPRESVLDVGCGTGALAIAARRRVGSGGAVCGVDPSPEMVARARRKATKAGVQVRFGVGAVETLPFPDATFDAVLSTLMLHHLTDEGRERGLAEVRRVLKPGGRLLAVDIGGGALGRHGRFLRIRKHADFDIRSLTPAFAAAALEVVGEGPVGGPPVVGLSNLRFILASSPPAT